MLRKCKYFLLSFIFFISSFMPCMYCHAQGSEWTDGEKQEFFAQGFYHIVCDVVGLILPTGLGGEDLKRDFEAYVIQGPWIQNNMSYDEWIAHEITGVYINGNTGNSDITLSADLQNALISWSNDWVSNNPDFYYAYSIDNKNLLNIFGSNETFQSIKQVFNTLLNSLNDKAGFVSGRFMGTFISSYNVYDTDLENLVFVLSESNETYCKVIPYTYNGLLNSWVVYSYDSDANNYLPQVNSGNLNNGRLYFSNVPIGNTSIGYQYDIATNGVHQFKVYKNANLITQGLSSYYVTDSYNSNASDNSITDSYNTTTNSINNSISYGDVQNYVNNYFVENNEYPTSNVVYNYINNYVPSDNGGGSGDNGGDNSNIFDFLGTIGEFLGNLIEGIGNVISGILSAITDVIDMFIGENGLPNVIGELVNYFLPFLPDWIPTVIGLSVTLALLIGIVKLIRGS